MSLPLIFHSFGNFYFTLSQTLINNHQTHRGKKSQIHFVLTICFHLKFPREEMTVVQSSVHVVILRLMSHAEFVFWGEPRLLFEAVLPAQWKHEEAFFIPTPAP